MIYIILATYHEEDNIGAVIFHLARTLKDIFFLIVDDSEDNKTYDSMLQAFTALRSSNYKYIHRGHKYGLGTAYRCAMEELSLLTNHDNVESDDMVVILDADLSHDPCDIARLAMHMHKTGADIVVGSRYRNGGSVSGWPHRRIIISSTANFIAQTILGLQVTDCTSSMRVYRLAAIMSIISQTVSTGFSIQLELISLAVARGYQVSEVPIHFSERINGSSSLSHKEIYRFIMLIAHLWWKQRLVEAHKTLCGQ
ncbi:Dolichol-phosphate mannosyltransferase [Giardia duodenalis]|uniref:Dolichol-phosphate mannosyltransferase subunit 1 n=2 Tax=Giardia intestinalis TaxID=5741 RepID=C6LVF3_GIAIB|nr:Dolichol-phosphate mannosyltransferase, putative [Giardia intestinalis ATCC 50581]ESU44803.1 Dolichol-phosphate mannosyltransferase [Giardia intestinalis]